MQTAQAPSAHTFNPTDFAFQIGHLTGVVEGLAKDFNEATKASRSTDKDTDTRLKTLERRGWIQQGVIIAASVAGSAVTQWAIYTLSLRPL